MSGIRLDTFDDATDTIRTSLMTPDQLKSRPSRIAYQVMNLQELVGWTITGVGVFDSGEPYGDDFPMLVLTRRGRERVAVVQRDSEANGPGYLAAD